PTTTRPSGAMSMTTLRQTTTTSTVSATETTAFQPDPNYYTFDNSIECDPQAQNADVQVVQAFVTVTALAEIPQSCSSKFPTLGWC
ncbi:MAG TPA: hypothetical protein VE569_13660, partial [Acidimicrobiia bacterium]|nr:hypothetical protein [Acidimicrobiia bacterium]